MKFLLNNYKSARFQEWGGLCWGWAARVNRTVGLLGAGRFQDVCNPLCFKNSTCHDSNESSTQACETSNSREAQDFEKSLQICVNNMYNTSSFTGSPKRENLLHLFFLIRTHAPGFLFAMMLDVQKLSEL